MSIGQTDPDYGLDDPSHSIDSGVVLGDGSASVEVDGEVQKWLALPFSRTEVESGAKDFDSGFLEYCSGVMQEKLGIVLI